MLEFDQIWLTFLLGMTAYIFSCVLMEDDMLFDWYRKLLNRLPDKLSYPLGNCDLCLSGQLALWIYIIMYDYHLLEHIFFISMTIFFTKIINITISRWEN